MATRANIKAGRCHWSPILLQAGILALIQSLLPLSFGRAQGSADECEPDYALTPRLDC